MKEAHIVHTLEDEGSPPLCTQLKTKQAPFCDHPLKKREPLKMWVAPTVQCTPLKM
jgi:hypothetical protein